MVLGPENGEQEAEEKHHQAKADQADDWQETNTHTQFGHSVTIFKTIFKSSVMKKEPEKEAAARLQRCKKKLTNQQKQKKKRNVSKSTVTNPSVILSACHFSNSLQVLCTSCGVIPG